VWTGLNSLLAITGAFMLVDCSSRAGTLLHCTLRDPVSLTKRVRLGQDPTSRVLSTTPSMTKVEVAVMCEAITGKRGSILLDLRVGTFLEQETEFVASFTQESIALRVLQMNRYVPLGRERWTCLGSAASGKLTDPDSINKTVVFGIHVR